MFHLSVQFYIPSVSPLGRPASPHLSHFVLNDAAWVKRFVVSALRLWFAFVEFRSGGTSATLSSYQYGRHTGQHLNTVPG